MNFNKGGLSSNGLRIGAGGDFGALHCLPE